MRYAWARRGSVALATLVSAVGCVVFGASGASGAEGAGASPSCGLAVTDVKPATGLQEKWRQFGDHARAGEWAGGDGNYSAPLPDGRVAWLFNDTFLGPVGEGSSITPQAPVHNTIVTADQTSDRPTRLIMNGSADSPLPLVGPPRTAEPWYWNGDGIVDDGKLHVFEFKQQAAGGGHFGFEWIATDLATFSVPGLELERVQPTYDANNVQWGVELLRDGDYVYVYGMETAFLDKYVHVARAPVGGLDGEWEFYTGSGWSPDEGDSARVLRAVGASFGVARVHDRYVLATTDQFLGSEIYLHTAATPFGFAGTDRVTIYDTPEGQPEYDEDAAGDIYTYNVAAHPDLGSRDTLVLSYNVNSTAIDDLNRDINNNRSRFIRVRFAPEPRTCLTHASG